jgi:uncharacterized protein YeaO (DUF488 family)
MIKAKRVYEPVEAADGLRILVDRLWPRGLKKEAVQIDLWMKEVAPSTELRKWFHHDPDRWKEFSKAYWDELKQSGKARELIDYIRQNKRVTLLYAASDEQHNHALLLLQYINKKVI